MSLWIFGYGSLLWDPGFLPAERVIARLTGYARSFCMLSIHYRGTEAAPGLVLALDKLPGAQCQGAALRVAEVDAAPVMQMLRERELISSAYEEMAVPLQLADGRTVTALAYVINPAHRQYCRLPLEQQAQMIARAAGLRGPNADYLHNTAAHLAELGIEDAELSWLSARVRAMTGV